MDIFDNFESGPNKYWTTVTTGGAYTDTRRKVLRLGYPEAHRGSYVDAQIDDYTMLGKSEYRWKFPLKMSIRARMSHTATDSAYGTDVRGTLQGTAGFGFWNKPFTMQGHWFTFPQSVWFFYSAPPSNMALATQTPGWGWKAQVVDTRLWRVIIFMLPTAIIGLVDRLRKKRGSSNRWLELFSGCQEKVIDADISSWHTYELIWKKGYTEFFVDDVKVFRSKTSPKNSLGFVAWIDNAYAITTSDGTLEFGRVDSGPQWLDIESVRIEQL